ncbi:TPA: recombination protein RecR [Candidatus Poribacteria bacterium]|nr:recombination protein RecR [Candidatus Poribacteria bacterium]HIB91445.1 recombination protein RecR [Candidatus Poribacteria bacterium]HIC02737.1 recombination protein RecR [Candidatus Poribacteria bacterium]HIN29506.1 recombination protein RecR [Candidatus Poribacteria bacterium]HIO06653.1 recombination protein RecR [Candidatus Poribacteria bacterium]
MIYPKPLEDLVKQLQKLPTIGPKTAQRLAFSILKMSEEEAAKVSKSISEVKTKLKYCTICGSITDQDPCMICTNPNRSHQIVCVIEEADDLLAIERTRQYKGVYHVLMGALSPLDGIGPRDLRIGSLLDRVGEKNIGEVIIATNYTTEGQATALYLAKQLDNFDVDVTRIAYGIPVGGDLEYIDDQTISRAIEGRRKINL